jgi:hypothetical protein
MKIFVRSINLYATEKMEFKRRRDFSLSISSRFLDWKFFTIKEVYTFLRILIFMGSDRKFKFEDYWRIPRIAGKAFSSFHNYISLRRFQFIYKLFTASFTSVNESAAISNINNFFRGAPIFKRRLTTRCQDVPPVNDRGRLPPGH